MKKCRNIILSMLFIITNITSLIPVHVYADSGRDISSNVTSLTVDPTNITDGGNIKVKFSFNEKKKTSSQVIIFGSIGQVKEIFAVKDFKKKSH